MLIHLIRHTTPDIESGVCYGQKNLDTLNSFEQEKNSIIARLKPQYDIVYSSPLKRCTQLAKTIKTREFAVDNDLMEVNFGNWEGKTWDEIPHSESKPWMDDFINVCPPNGESLTQMQQRVQRFIEHHLKPNEQKNTAIVTHAGVIRLFFVWALNIPLENIFKIKLDYGVVIEMDYQSTEFGASVRFL